jgi:16S rRNA (adenine1518-N6/adenine1519-N6)-dimethyltransferase
MLDAGGHRPDRRLGQNFLADPNVVQRIVATADVAGRKVVEIGAGTGALTTALAPVADVVVAYEVDDRLIPILGEALGRAGNVEVRLADASRIDLCAELGPGPWTMVANLPYNVGTGILLDTLRHAPCVERLVVMVQAEVADRLLAAPGSRTYGLPSVVVGLHARGRRAFGVPRQVFEPRPRVDSAVIVLDRVPAPDDSERAIEIAAAGFGKRRKMLRGSLVGTVEDPSALLTRAGIAPTSRPEHLAPIDYVAIARAEAEGEGRER